MFRCHYVYCLLLSLSVSVANLTRNLIQNIFVDHQSNAWKKEIFFYKLDKIMCSQIMFAYYLLVSIKIVSSESGAKPMIKLTSVFYDHGQYRQ